MTDFIPSFLKVMFLKEILIKIKDYVFPVFCLGCKKEGEWLCDDCLKKINKKGVFCCPVCHSDTEKGRPCFKCQDKSILSSTLAITIYKEEGLIGRVIQTLKYSFAEDVLSVFKKLINIFVFENKNLFTEFNIVVPVPLHKKRFVERGFNQAELVADILACELNISYENLISRNRHTKQQAKLNREGRLENVKDAFIAKGCVGKNIVLVDDVFTTGTTLQECAKALKKAGANKVVGFTVARG